MGDRSNNQHPPICLSSSVAVLEEGELLLFRLVEDAGTASRSGDVNLLGRWSPLGRALLGRYAGDFVTVNTKSAAIDYEVFGVGAEHQSTILKAHQLEIQGDVRGRHYCSNRLATSHLRRGDTCWQAMRHLALDVMSRPACGSMPGAPMNRLTTGSTLACAFARDRTGRRRQLPSRERTLMHQPARCTNLRRIGRTELQIRQTVPRRRTIVRKGQPIRICSRVL